MKFLVLAAAMFVGFSAHAGLEAYAGTYSGKFEGHKGMINVTANGGTLSASFTGVDGSDDLLGEGCGSSIGKMLKLDMDGSEVDYATFVFSAGNCSSDVQGNELVLDFSHDDGVVDGLRASVFARTESGWGTQCYPDPNGGMHCWPQQTTTNVFAEGKFKK